MYLLQRDCNENCSNRCTRGRSWTSCNNYIPGTRNLQTKDIIEEIVFDIKHNIIFTI